MATINSVVDKIKAALAEAEALVVIDPPPPPPPGTPPTLGDVPDQRLEVGAPFTLSVLNYAQATEGDAVTFDLIGELPPGVAFDPATGQLSGTPTQVGQYPVSVRAIDDDGVSAADAVLLTVVAPPPPVDSGLGVIVSKPVNGARTLMMPGFMGALVGYDPGRYERWQNVVVVRGATAQLRATTNDFAAGGRKAAFGAAQTLTLTFDGVPVATKDVLATDVAVVFDVDLTNIAEGWYKTSATGLDATWTVLDYAVYVLKGAVAQPQTKMPVVSGSYSLVNSGALVHHFAWVPAQFAPTILPLVPRECPHFSDPPKRSYVVVTQLVHGRFGDTYRPVVTKDGIVASANLQPYFFFDFQQARVKLPLLDGPRGRGSLFCPTHLEVGKAAPTAAEGAALGPIDNVYFTDPWRVGKVRENGDVVTLAGWRHNSLPHFHADPQNCELVGDWSAIPVERRGFHELWGMAWRVPATDYTADPIPTERNLRPHVSGVQTFVADQRRIMPNGKGRIVKLQFSPTSHSTPPVVTELNGDGWNQCFDVVGYDDVLYASDRMNHRIRVLSMDDGHVIEEWTGIRQPEGLALHERGDGWWLYYTTSIRSSLTAEGSGIIDMQIRRRHVVTKEDVLICARSNDATLQYLINGNSLLAKIAVSDGTFGPRGMIGFVTWSNVYQGYPIFIDGETGAVINWLNRVQYVDPPAKGMGQPGQTYTSAVGFGNGRVVWGTACDGLFTGSFPLPTDTVWSAAVATGEKQYKERGLILTHGHYGMGQYGLPLPWGTTPEIDAFLTAHGHTRTT